MASNTRQVVPWKYHRNRRFSRTVTMIGRLRDCEARVMVRERTFCLNGVLGFLVARVSGDCERNL